MGQRQPKSRFRDAVVEQMQRRGLSPADVSQMCGGKPAADHIHSYTTMKGAIGEINLDRLCKALGLHLFRIPLYVAKPHVIHAGKYGEYDTEHGWLRLMFPEPNELNDVTIHNLTPEQLREIAARCNEVAGAIEKTMRPEANPSLNAIGEPDEVDDTTPDTADQIPF